MEPRGLGMASTTESLTPAQRSMRARVAAYAMHARHDGRAVTAKARAAFLAGFEQRVDPEGVLPVEERRRRAEQERKAHFTRLALASSRARRARAAGGVGVRRGSEAN